MENSTKSINFISVKDLKETRIMHSKSDNVKIMMGSETNDIIEKISKKIIKINAKKWVCFW